MHTLTLAGTGSASPSAAAPQEFLKSDLPVWRSPSPSAPGRRTGADQDRRPAPVSERYVNGLGRDQGRYFGEHKKRGGSKRILRRAEL